MVGARKKMFLQLLLILSVFLWWLRRGTLAKSPVQTNMSLRNSERRFFIPHCREEGSSSVAILEQVAI